MNKPILLLLALIVTSLCSLLCSGNAFADEHGIPKLISEKGGYVPDAQTAIRIAEAVWLAHFGAKATDRRPFTAELNGDTWYVSGTNPKGWRGGGAPEAEISKSTGEIKRIALAR